MLNLFCNSNTFITLTFLAGCAQGIGASIADQLFQAGARLVAADLNDAKGQSIIDGLQHNKHERCHDATYVHVDISNYDEIRALFKCAVDVHGRVDMAIHCAAITEIGGWFVPGADLASAVSVSNSIDESDKR